MKIYKYVLKFVERDRRLECELTMPIGAKALSVGCQGATPVVWCSVNLSAQDAKRVFVCRLTGELFKPAGEFVGTFQIPDGIDLGLPFVGHVFDCGNGIELDGRMR